MLYYISEQLRAWNVPMIFKFVSMWLAGGEWSHKEAISIVKGEREDCNILEILKDILNPKTKYDLDETKYTGAIILEKVEMYLLKNPKAAKNCKVVGDGRTRAVSLAIAAAFSGDDFAVKPKEAEIELDDLRTESFQENLKHDFATKLSKVDKTIEILGLLESGKLITEADVERQMKSRYYGQEFFGRANLVRHHDFTPQEAAEPIKEDARKASKSADARKWLKENAATKSNEPKAVSGKDVRELCKLLVEGGVSPDNDLHWVLRMVATGDESSLRDLCYSTIKAAKALEATTD